MNHEMLPQMLEDFESRLGLSNCRDMAPWDVIIAIRDRLPPQQQKMADLFAKLNEAQEILSDLQTA